MKILPLTCVDCGFHGPLYIVYPMEATVCKRCFDESYRPVERVKPPKALRHDDVPLDGEVID